MQLIAFPVFLIHNRKKQSAAANAAALCLSFFITLSLKLLCHASSPIKTALDRVQPAPEAQERMLRNIRRKSAPRRLRLQWVLLPAAACLALLLMLPAQRTQPPQRPTGPLTALPPAISGPEVFAPLGISLTPPPEAQQVRYTVLEDTVAEMDFVAFGVPFRCLASRICQETLWEPAGPVTVLLQQDGLCIRRAGDALQADIRLNGLNFTMLCTQPVPQEQFQALAEYFLQEISKM